MRRHLALNKEQTFFHIDAKGQQQGIGLQRIFAEFSRFLANGYGVQIRKRVNAAVFILHGGAAPPGAQKIAERNASAGLNRAKDRLFFGSCVFHPHNFLSI